MGNLDATKLGFIDTQREFLKTVASMAYGTGFNEGEKGGKGNIGLVRDQAGNLRVIKFNTHHSQADKAQKKIDGKQSLPDELKKMVAASDELRTQLRSIGEQLGMPKADLDRILGSGETPQKLLTRAVVAKFITAAQASEKAGNALKDIWAGGAAFVSRSDMSFATVTLDKNLDALSREASRSVSADESGKLYQALDELCFSKAEREVVPADFKLGTTQLFFRKNEGKVQYQYANGLDALGDDNWKETGVPAYDLRSRLVREIIASDSASPSVGTMIDAMLQNLDNASAAVRTLFRQDCVFYLKERTGLPNHNFTDVTTARLMNLAKEVSGCADKGQAQLLAKRRLADFAEIEKTGVSNTRDVLEMVEVSKAEPNAGKVVFESKASQGAQEKTDPSAKFRNLAADIVKLADSTSVDRKLNSPKVEKKVAEERKYVDEQMKILDMKDEELAVADEATRERHEVLVKKLEQHKKTVQKIPDELFAKCLERTLLGNYKGTLVKEKLSAMQKDFKESHQQTNGPTLTLDRHEYTTADANEPIEAWMKRGDNSPWCMNHEDKQRVPLTEVLRNMLGECEHDIHLTTFNPDTHKDVQASFNDIKEEVMAFLEACKKTKPEDIAPQKADAERAVEREIHDYVRKTFFDKDGNQITDRNKLAHPVKSTVSVTVANKRSLDSVQKEFKAFPPPSFVESESRELLLRELLSELSDPGVEDTADGMRMLEAIGLNRDALAKLIAGGKDAEHGSGDATVKGILSILAKDDGLSRMLDIGEAEKKDEELCRQKIDAFLERHVIDRKVVYDLGVKIRAFANERLMIAQDEFSQVLKGVHKKDELESDFMPDSATLTWTMLTNQYGGKYSRYYPYDIDDVLEKVKFAADKTGYGKFLNKVLAGYFVQQPLQVRMNLVSSSLRNSQDGGSDGEKLGGLLKGAGPLLLKLLQAFDPKGDPTMTAALEDMKTNLTPIPQDVLQAHLLDVVNRSGGRIERITVKKTLGSASVGQTLLCRLEGPGVQKGGMDVVVKILRPDALNLLRAERDFMLKCAAEANMGPAYEKMIDKIMEEFDFTLEAKNIELSKVYNGVKTGVQTLDALPLVEAAPGTLLLRLAPGQTLDALFKDVGQIKSGMTEKFNVHYKLGFEAIDTDYKSQADLYFRNHQNDFKFKPVSQDVMREQFKEVKDKVAELRTAYRHLSDLTEVWIKESCSKEGSGFYHGDLHAGNIMVDPQKGITTIDLGNVSTFEKKEKDGLLELLKICNKVPCGFADPATKGKNMTPDFVGRVLSGYADEFYKTLCGMLPPEASEKLASEYENSAKSKFEGDIELTSLKHEFMVILSSYSGRPAPFDRLSAILDRLQLKGISIPKSITRFLSSALRLKREVNELVRLEKHLFDTLGGLASYSQQSAPELFTILSNGTVEYNVVSDKYEYPPRVDQKMKDGHIGDLKDRITSARQLLSRDARKWEEVKKSVAWTGDEELVNIADQIEKADVNDSAVKQLVENLSMKICEFEVRERENNTMLVKKELDEASRPKGETHESFEQIFNRVIAAA